MEFEPNLVVPCPFPLESSKVMERSASLDLTPEKALVNKSKFLRTNTQCCSYGATNLSLTGAAHQDVVDSKLPPHLSVPQLHSTTHLCSRMQSLRVAQGAMHQSASHSFSSNDGGLDDLASIVTQKPLREVNVARNVTRYKDLVSVEVSDESFQKLAFKPHRTRRAPEDKEVKHGAEVRVRSKEPSLMDLFIPSLEFEEAEWNCTRMELNCAKPVAVEEEDVYLLHSLMKTFFT